MLLCNFLDHLATSVRSVTPSLEKYSFKSRHRQNEYTYAIIELYLSISQDTIKSLRNDWSSHVAEHV